MRGICRGYHSGVLFKRSYISESKGARVDKDNSKKAEAHAAGHAHDSRARDARLSGFIKKYGLQADAQQLAVIGGGDGAVNLIATAGSGKTSTVINRIGYMTRVLDTPPDSILAVTYTRAAAGEMRERYISTFCGGEQTEELPNFSTINAFCAGVVRRAQREGLIPPYKIPKETEMVFNAVVREAYARQSGNFLTDTMLSELRLNIGRIKNQLLYKREDFQKAVNAIELSPDLTGIDLYEFYRAYNSILVQNRWMDFDDQMRYALRCFEKYPELLRFYAEKYRYIILDESQDTSMLQFQLIHLLAGENMHEPHGGDGGAPASGLMICGDDDQSIYSFRGASPELIFEFNERYQEAKTFYLETNYRSSGEIVEAAARLISHNKKRFDKKIRPLRKAGAGRRSKIKLIEEPGLEEQYSTVLALLRKFTAEHPNKKIAVLYKNNDSAIPLIDLADTAGIQFSCKKDSFTFFSLPVVNDIKNIINVIIDDHDAESFMRVYNKAGGLYISRAEAEAWIPQIKKDGLIATIGERMAQSPDEMKRQNAVRYCEMYKEASAARPADAIDIILKKGRYERYLKARQLSEASARTQLRKIDTLRVIAEKCGTLESFLAHIRQLDADTYMNDNSNICFSTIHSAKGLEYDTVIFIDPYDDIFQQGGDGDMEELRRLFYVGVTRAKSELIFCAADRAYGVKNELSGFYYEFTGIEDPRVKRYNERMKLIESFLKTDRMPIDEHPADRDERPGRLTAEERPLSALGIQSDDESKAEHIESKAEHTERKASRAQAKKNDKSTAPRPDISRFMGGPRSRRNKNNK